MERTEKLHLLAKYFIQLYNSKTPYYMEVLQKACLLYRELYLLPIYEKMGETPAKIRFVERGMKDEQGGEYVSEDDRVDINFERVWKRSAHPKVVAAFSAIMSIAHEDEHALQWRIGKKIYERQSLDKIKLTAENKVIEAGQGYLDILIGKNLYNDEDDVKTMLQFLPELYRDAKKLCLGKNNLEEVVKLCTTALYAQSIIERDARRKSREIMSQCIDELQPYLVDAGLGKNPTGFIHAELKDDKFYEEKNEEKYAPIVKKIGDAYTNLSPAKFENFGREFYKESVKGFRAYQEGYGDAELKEVEVKKSIFREAIKLYAEKRLNCENRYEKTQLLLGLRDIFIKHGWLFASDVLFEEGLLPNYTGNAENYYSVLKSGQVSKNSFDFIQRLPRTQINDLLISYINKGQTQFVEQILTHATPESISRLLYWSTNTYRRKVENGEAYHMPSDADEIMEQNLLFELQKRYIDLVNKQKRKEILFDDIDDYIKMIAKFCKVLSVDHSQLSPQINGNSFEKEAKLTLLDLYKKAEQLGVKQVELMRGYKPLEEEYSYASPVHREQYLLKPVDREKRVKLIYGEIEYDRVMTEREANEEYDYEQGLGV